MENITVENYKELMSTYVDENKLTIKKVSKAIGCSELTLMRLILGKTIPSDDMLKQTGILFELGFKKYSKLSDAEKEKISELMGSIGGGALGFATITAAVSTFGVAGLSAAGISSGLAVLGGVIGGGMIAGVTVAATIPIATGLAGYGVIKLLKGGFQEVKVSMKNIDLKWEVVMEGN